MWPLVEDLHPSVEAIAVLHPLPPSVVAVEAPAHVGRSWPLVEDLRPSVEAIAVLHPLPPSVVAVEALAHVGRSVRQTILQHHYWQPCLWIGFEYMTTVEVTSMKEARPLHRL
jgi:hypothetical protein